ncbi:serine beta-lactamase-like protein LACTB, mitochondrial [Actinia tenebrosa]|uniref:Serine beta-lactamase-like protein LACTB, mitochondrial n=1 Tax=Actinia tenebrosa TaxID=6105 RepID=A0A6P8JCJ4_ACTTE|nr:serine beta-lactamase-like protein LACTB, mitochondrial [Actinia tenebrosa]
MAAATTTFASKSKSFVNQSFFLPTRLLAFRNTNLTCLAIKRQITGLSSGKEVLFKSQRSFRSVFLAFGTAVSLACVLVLRERNRKVRCEEQALEDVKSDDSKPTSSDLCPRTRLLDPVSLKVAIEESRVFLQQVSEETGAPGLVVAVSIDGKLVWSEGLGYADLENNVKCTPKTVMRIASISKPLTAAAAAKLYEQDKLDIDAPIQKYVPTFPQKFYKGKQVTITTRQLLSHLGGIRHYNKNTLPKEDCETKKEDNAATSNQDQEKDNTEKLSKSERKSRKENKKEFDNEEYYIKDPKTIIESLALFQDDPLVGEPGEKFLYTSHGYTMVSAVIESAAQEDFLSYMKKLFRELGMNNTGPEFNHQIIYNRARFYQRDKKNGLVNAPYVDNSYKWAGGGFISTAEDLVKFGNAMLYSSQVGHDDKLLPGILKPETIKEMWKEVDRNKGTAHKDGWYGWGWYVLSDKQTHGACRHVKQTIFHTGGAVGAVSVLLIRPHYHTQPSVTSPPTPPGGIVVSIIMNLQETSRSIQATGKQVADIFEEKLEEIRE